VSNQCVYKTKVGGIFFKSRGLLSEPRSIAIGYIYYKNKTEKYKFMPLPLHYNFQNVWVFQ